MALVRVRSGAVLSHEEAVHHEGTVLELPDRLVSDPAVRGSVEPVAEVHPDERIAILERALADNAAHRIQLQAALEAAHQAAREAAAAAAVEAEMTSSEEV